MATNEGTETTNEDKQTAGDRRVSKDPAPPAGFDTRVGRERGDGWLKKTPGQVVVGRILGRFGMKGQKNDDGSIRVFYQIKLLEDCSHVKDGKRVPGVLAVWQNPDNKEEKKEVVLEPGAILNIDEHKAIEDLGPYTRDGGLYDVWMQYVSEDPLPKDRRKTFWRMKGPSLKTIKQPTRSPLPDNIQDLLAGEGAAENDIPF